MAVAQGSRVALLLAVVLLGGGLVWAALLIYGSPTLTYAGELPDDASGPVVLRCATPTVQLRDAEGDVGEDVLDTAEQLGAEVEEGLVRSATTDGSGSIDYPDDVELDTDAVLGEEGEPIDPSTPVLSIDAAQVRADCANARLDRWRWIPLPLLAAALGMPIAWANRRAFDSSPPARPWNDTLRA